MVDFIFDFIFDSILELVVIGFAKLGLAFIPEKKRTEKAERFIKIIVIIIGIIMFFTMIFGTLTHFGEKDEEFPIGDMMIYVPLIYFAFGLVLTVISKVRQKKK